MTTDVLPEAKACRTCGESKPLADFYPQKAGKYGREGSCRACKTKTRTTTAERMARNRARHRAVARLIELHPDEFQRLLETELQAALEEHARLTSEAADRGHEDAVTARLKPGPKREGQASAVERLDVARCPQCIKHHDRGHVCTECGSRPSLLLTLPGGERGRWIKRGGIKTWEPA